MTYRFSNQISALMTVAGLLTSTGAWAKGTAAAPVTATTTPAARKAVATSSDPRKFIEELYQHLNELSKKTADLTALHKVIGDDLETVVDFAEMARLTLPGKWDTLVDAQKTEFTGLLTKMVRNTYVKRWKPGNPVEIQYGKVATPAGDKADVATTITVNKTSAEVLYKLHQSGGHWLVWDIVVDDASQVQTYRSSFKKVLEREGWDGLIKRMKKAADKKAA